MTCPLFIALQSLVRSVAFKAANPPSDPAPVPTPTSTIACEAPAPLTYYLAAGALACLLCLVVARIARLFVPPPKQPCTNKTVTPESPTASNKKLLSAKETLNQITRLLAAGRQQSDAAVTVAAIADLFTVKPSTASLFAACPTTDAPSVKVKPDAKPAAAPGASSAEHGRPVSADATLSDSSNGNSSSRSSRRIKAFRSSKAVAIDSSGRVQHHKR
ncbi:hypothetical protein H4R19_001622 [Coemansia spiralis]|nr:hypothetical protein H4R19_001622 [Coemansia spiralis]